jgi:hypothetical protein
MLNLMDREMPMSVAKVSRVRHRFTPCTARVSLLEAVRGARENFRMNLPGGFLRKNRGRTNQQPNEIQLLKERTRQRQLK